MRKHLKISFTGLLGLLLLCGCSSDDSLFDAENIEQGDLVEVSLTSRSKASASVSPTRAALAGDEDMDIPNIGIFGLARQKQDINNSPMEVSWFDTSTNWSGCILDNVAAHKDGYNIVWDDPTARYFYPITQFYAYDFYGYYPYKPSNELIYGNNIVTVNYVLDGMTDLLWGRATSSDAYAYSARYFRTTQTTDSRPNVPLQHLLTRFVFWVVPGESYEGSGDYSEAALMQVDTLQIIDTYTNVAVTIADHNNLNMALTDRIYRNTITDTLMLHSIDNEGNAIDLVPVHLEDPQGQAIVPKQLGESIMLYPQSRYTIRICITMDAYHDSVTDTDIPEQHFISEVPLQLVSNNVFAQGNSYDVTITVHGPRAVKLAATLTPWSVQEGPSIEL